MLEIIHVLSHYKDVLDISQFDFHLPEELIAQTPAEKREKSRLLVVDRQKQQVTHHVFEELPDLLPSPLDIVRNDAKVLKARIHAQRPTGGSVECLLLSPYKEGNAWWCLLKPGKKLPPGATFGIPGEFQATVIEKKPDGENLVAFNCENGQSVFDLASKFGEMPLPPYIRREKGDERTTLDNERYQTVYANPHKIVAAAAPTAGLHFTPEINEQLSQRGHRFSNVTLHVGLGTFRPIQVQKVEEHEIHREMYEIPPDTLDILDKNERPLLSIGTTTVRTIEDYARKKDRISRSPSAIAEADIYIYPPATFSFTNHLLTNFHLPKSTLLCLVSAFLTPGSLDGIKWLNEIYSEAIDKNYRFFSYGDAMLIL